MARTPQMGGNGGLLPAQGSVGGAAMGLNLGHIPTTGGMIAEALNNPPQSSVPFKDAAASIYGTKAALMLQPSVAKLRVDKKTLIDMMKTAKAGNYLTGQKPLNFVNAEPPHTYGNGGSGAKNPDDLVLQKVGTALTAFRSAYQNAVKNNLGAPSISNTGGEFLNGFSDFSKHPALGGIASQLTSGEEAANRAMFEDANKALEALEGKGGKTQNFYPIYGEGQKKLDATYSAMLGAAQARAQGYLDKLKMTDPVRAQQFADKMNATFGPFKPGMEGPGTTTSQMTPSFYPAPNGTNSNPLANELTPEERQALGARANDPVWVSKMIANRGK